MVLVTKINGYQLHLGDKVEIKREGGREGGGCPSIVIPSSPRPLLPPPHLEHTGYCYICHKNLSK